MAELVAMRLKREHYDVEVVHDGLEGLSKIRSARPDLVLLDLMLPSMSGTEVTMEHGGKGMGVFRGLVVFLKGVFANRATLAVENLALRQQLAEIG